MNHILINLYVKLQELRDREEGQDLVEYALVVALIAFGAVTGMGALASGINGAFSSVSTQLGSAMCADVDDDGEPAQPDGLICGHSVHGFCTSWCFEINFPS